MRTTRVFFAVLVACSLAAIGPETSRSDAADRTMTEEGVQSLVDLKIDDEVIVARIKKAGLSFAPDEAALKRLTDAGASAAVLDAVREAGTKKPATSGLAAVTYADILKLLQLEIPDDQILMRLAKSPTVFTLSPAQIAELKAAGATEKLLTALQAAREISPQSAELITNFALVLDCSGSMKELTKEGETKMEAAKRVVADLIQKIPEGLNVTFVIYGHEVFGGADDPRNCQAVKVARPLSPLNAAGKSELSTLVARLKPTGGTPLALSLKVTGEELAKDKDAYCGIVLITDGLESCKGDPTAEVAALLAKLKLSFGVNVVGLGVRADEDAALKAIADAGKGKYYDADDAGALADSISAIAKEIQAQTKPPVAIVSGRRAVKVVEPKIELLPMKEIWLTEANAPNGATLSSYVKAKTAKYGEEIRIPSGTVKYTLWWVPKEGRVLEMTKDLSFPERKVVEIKPEDYLGLIRVKGTGAVKQILVVPAGSPGSTRTSYTIQEAKKFGDLMIVPAGSYDIWVDEAVIEEGLEVSAAKLYELE